jgi:hypothetical protein
VTRGEQPAGYARVKTDLVEHPGDRLAAVGEAARRAHLSPSAGMIEARHPERTRDRLGAALIDVGAQAEQPAAALDPSRLRAVQRLLEVAAVALAEPEPAFRRGDRRAEKTSSATASPRQRRRPAPARRQARPERSARGRTA